MNKVAVATFVFQGTHGFPRTLRCTLLILIRGDAPLNNPPFHRKKTNFPRKEKKSTPRCSIKMESVVPLIYCAFNKLSKIIVQNFKFYTCFRKIFLPLKMGYNLLKHFSYGQIIGTSLFTGSTLNTVGCLSW